MKDFKESVGVLLQTLEQYGGNPPQFSIDYRNKKIELFYSTSGFIKLLQSKKALTSLDNGKITILFFKD